MKFGSNFQEALRRDEYPREWIDSAIPYKKLKKCIKRVQEELQSLGLDNDTLQQLWQHVGDMGPEHLNAMIGKDDDRMVHYDIWSKSDSKFKFTPKLTIALDPRDGSPMDAWLSPETRRVLRRVGKKQLSTNTTTQSQNEALAIGRLSLASDIDGGSVSEGTPSPDDKETHLETIEVPLTSDSEFFQILRKELECLEALQKSEQKRMEQDIIKLGDDLRELKSSKRKRSKEEIQAWREIFRIYLDSQVFLSSHELDAGARDAAHAQKQLQHFDQALISSQGQKIKLSNEALATLERFKSINVNLLRLLKYQEINQLALTKILKKFDKQTALHAQRPMLNQLQKSQSFMTRDLAKATCFVISDELIKIFPQVEDYLCPVCFSLSYKPIRLRCGHVFCIRCLIVMQRAEQDNCPLCREHVVLEATGENLDESLMRFLKQNFPNEVKAKQKENQIAAGVDQFGEGFEGTHKCVVM